MLGKTNTAWSLGLRAPHLEIVNGLEDFINFVNELALNFQSLLGKDTITDSSTLAEQLTRF